MDSQVDTTDGRILAAIDLGSNSFHLGIARAIASDIQPMHRLKQRVQLAEDSDEDGNLCPAAIDRGLECLKQFSQRLSEMQFDQIRIVATYALRQAPNRYQFIEQARAILDYPIEVIPGREEARLIFHGVCQNQVVDQPTLVIDIGGGSTELIIGQGHTPIELESLSMGCVSFQSRFFPEGKLSPKRMKRAILAAEQQLELLQQRYLRTGFEAAIGCSGTIKAIALLLNDGDLTVPINRKALQQLARQVGDCEHVDQLPFEQLAELRRKVLPSGLAILLACFRQLEIEQMQFSEFALREGVLSELANQQSHLDIQARTIQSLQQRYQLDTRHSVRIQVSAQQLYRQFEVSKKRLGRWLEYAAALHEIGLQVNYRGIHKHGEYILSNANLSGFNTEEQSLLAFLVRWQRKKLTGCPSPPLQMLSNSQLWPLLIALRLSIMLHLGRRHHIALPQLQQQEKTLMLTFSAQLSDDDLLLADLEQEQQHLAELGWQLHWQ